MYVDIADILGHKYRDRIDIGKGNIGPTLMWKNKSGQTGRSVFLGMRN